tara:strand:+ start:950 stop:1276 length:327 start_codon:yes stop_codon:yes gene_type:complete
MNKPSSLIWMVIILFLILPTPAGRFFIDLAGGIFIFITLIPLILGGLGWLAWRNIQSKVQTCENCGSSFLNNQINCPICGQGVKNIKENFENIPASAATIDIKTTEID